MTAIQPTHESARYAALYYRVSSDQQDVARQRRDVPALAHRHLPESVLVEFTDDGVSAFKTPIFERPGGRKLCEAIERGEVEAVFADAQDRLSRGELIEWFEFAALCKAFGTRIITAQTGEAGDDFTSQILGAINGIVARKESADKSHRTKSGQRAAIAAGRWPGGNPPWGYVRGDDGVLQPSPDAPLIREAFTRYAEGAPMAQVCRFLTGALKLERETVPLSFLGKLLRNPTYAGFIVTGTKNGAPVQHQGAHEPLCPPDRFEMVQERLRLNRDTGHRDSPQSPFGPAARCGACGTVLRVRREQKGFSYSGCNNSACLEVKPMPPEHLEAFVVSQMYAMLLWLELALDTGDWRELLGDTSEGDRLTGELEQLAQGRDTITRLASEGLLTLEEATARLRANERQAAALKPHAHHHSATEQQLREELEALREKLSCGGRRPAVFWREASRPEKRRFIEQTLQLIVLGNETITLTFQHLPLPLEFPITRTRRNSAQTPAFEEWGYTTADDATRERREPQAVERRQVPPAAEVLEAGAVSDVAPESEVRRLSPQRPRARSRGRSLSPPYGAPQARD